MSVVFLSGSRALSRLNDAIRSRLRNVVDNGHDVIIGDANGADRAMQVFLAEINYRKVKVYCSGPECRNNLGGWQTQNVTVDPGLKGRAFYQRKDVLMAEAADFGMVLWDGSSEGSAANIIELLKQDKKTVVYLARDRRFHCLSGLRDFAALLGSGSGKSNADIKSRLSIAERELEKRTQTAFNLR